MSRLITRRGLLTGLGLAAPAVAAAWVSGGSLSVLKRQVQQSGEWLSLKAHQSIGRNALAPEYTRADLSPQFRTNGSIGSDDATYLSHQSAGFAGWHLVVDGLVARPLQLSLAALRALPARTQITRHDCVEGWSAIGEWRGPQLSLLLDRAGLLPAARYIVFWCADSIRGWQYYESIDLIDAFHPQTILAYDMNGEPLPAGHGAPLRLRVERQLGYKHAKYVMRVEAVASLAGVREGKGGFWEDAAGYEWYAGI